ncbi:MAG TPA: hypothetical protein VHI52_20050 [Verrucomicrobiae bacterium]|nr:hypothetical protein [Verrucomicrobiae bacterium]
MKLKLKEDPREWRKSTLLTLLGLAMLSSVLCWRHVLLVRTWRTVLIVLAVGAIAAWLQPRWFRGYYRVSTRLGFWSSQIVARVVLAVIFALLVTPLGILFRLSGKDSLKLKQPAKTDSYWEPARKCSPLDQMF